MSVLVQVLHICVACDLKKILYLCILFDADVVKW